MGIHFEACAPPGTARPSPWPCSPGCPPRPARRAPRTRVASVARLTWLANARRSREPLTKSALLSRSSPCSRSATASSSTGARAPPSRDDSADCAGGLLRREAGNVALHAAPGLHRRGRGVRSHILRLRLGVLIVGVERAPGTAAHRAARERAGARAVAEPSFRVANEEPRRGSVRLRCRQWKRARVFSGQSSGRGTRRARPTGLERNPPRADRPSASQHGESPRHVCPRTLERAAQTRWLSPRRTSASLPRSRRCNARPERAAPPPSFAAGAPRPRARRRILPPSSPRDAPWRVAPPRTSRASPAFLSRSARPRAPAPRWYVQRTPLSRARGPAAPAPRRVAHAGHRYPSRSSSAVRFPSSCGVNVTV